jgi:hypothetical protein
MSSRAAVSGPMPGWASSRGAARRVSRRISFVEFGHFVVEVAVAAGQ